MSLILTVISQEGIIHAADSNLSSRQGPAGTGQKVFSVPYLQAAISVAGSYSVAGTRMDLWMLKAIEAYGANPKPTVPGLGEHLRFLLETEMLKSEKNGGCLIHLCGYVATGAGSHPEFYFIRNITGIDPGTGAYDGFAEAFTVSEDFWTRDYLTAETQHALRSGGEQIYINGYPAGRIGYLALMKHFGQFMRAIWSEPQWRFRRPVTLAESALLVDLQLRAIGALFQISDYPAPYIGGDAQIELLPAPADRIVF